MMYPVRQILEKLWGHRKYIFRKPENWEHFECTYDAPKVSPKFAELGTSWSKGSVHSKCATQYILRTPVEFILSVFRSEHCDRTTRKTVKSTVNEPSGKTVGTFFGKIQGVPTDYLIRTLGSHRPENCECTDHFTHQEHRKKIGSENFKCIHSVLGWYRAGTLSMYSRCIYDVLGRKTGVRPQCNER